MKRFSGLFWFTALGGVISSVFLNMGLLWHLSAQLREILALCTPHSDACSAEAIDRAFHTFCVMALAGTALMFWCAYRLGRVFLKPKAGAAG